MGVERRHSEGSDRIYELSLNFDWSAIVKLNHRKQYGRSGHSFQWHGFYTGRNRFYMRIVIRCQGLKCVAQIVDTFGGKEVWTCRNDKEIARDHGDLRCK